MILIAIGFAYIMSKFITKSLKTISDKMYKTRFEKGIKKISLKGASSEIKSLVESYNKMVDALEESAKKLALNEREQAWREMAKQVAHEIKNPLTPMRLSVQSFQSKFDPNDKQILTKVNEYSKTLIQQIDTMSKIAEAFSSFAKMPAQNLELLDLEEVIDYAIDIFPNSYVTFLKPDKKIKMQFDRDHLNRIITNLLKNSVQSIPDSRDPKIKVKLYQNNDIVYIEVEDNGAGIDEVISQKIFEPKFTTKTSGMGLGLPMVKNIIEVYQGSISFQTNINKGTIFKISFPKTNK